MTTEGHNALFVEGPDDRAVVNALALKGLAVDLAETKLVKAGKGTDDGGFEQALSAFRDAAPVIQPGGRVGLLVDRDGVDGKPDRWGAVRAALVQLGVEPPVSPPAEGWVTAGKTPGSLIGVWLMPDNLGPGDLEGFLEELLLQDRALWTFAVEATNHAAMHSAKYLPKDLRKATIHAWTAWLNPPGGGYGLAIKRGDLAHDSPAAARFLAWFRKLFHEAA